MIEIRWIVVSDCLGCPASVISLILRAYDRGNPFVAIEKPGVISDAGLFLCPDGSMVVEDWLSMPD